ncbi:hypothetical protein C8J31_1343 [Rhizobium sp. PP-CC-2G-626]|nr:hypothetical protein C8J31_1343 [Rhizobium sp. PP-CC-2G-626]
MRSCRSSGHSLVSRPMRFSPVLPGGRPAKSIWRRCVRSTVTRPSLVVVPVICGTGFPSMQRMPARTRMFPSAWSQVATYRQLCIIAEKYRKVGKMISKTAFILLTLALLQGCARTTAVLIQTGPNATISEVSVARSSGDAEADRIALRAARFQFAKSAPRPLRNHKYLQPVNVSDEAPKPVTSAAKPRGKAARSMQ